MGDIALRSETYRLADGRRGRREDDIPTLTRFMFLSSLQNLGSIFLPTGPQQLAQRAHGMGQWPVARTVGSHALE